jgi:exopolysaccharide production protein ExoZ
MTETRGIGAKKIASLEGFRGVAVLLVFLVHYSVAWTMLFPGTANDNSMTGVLADMAFSVGNAGVDLFMALSGYLIYDHLMQRPQSFASYFGRRVRRIFPVYLVVLTIYVLLMLVDPAKSKLPTDPVAAVMYVIECALLIPGIFGREPIVGIAWSLTYEVMFYLLLPLLIWATGLRRRRWIERVAILCIVFVSIVLVALSIRMHERVIMFVGGMLTREALIRWSGEFPRPRLIEATALMLLASVLIYVTVWRGPAPFAYPEFPHAFIRSLALCISLSLLLATALGTHGVCRKAFESTPLRLMGEFSYSFYLIHNLTMRIGLPVVASHIRPAMAGWFYWVAMPIALAICIIPGLGLYGLIERPFSLRRPIQIRFRKSQKTMATDASRPPITLKA